MSEAAIAAFEAARPCRIAVGVARVRASDNRAAAAVPRPRRMVWCGPPQGTPTDLTTPQTIIDGLSASATGADRGRQSAVSNPGAPTLRPAASG